MVLAFVAVGEHRSQHGLLDDVLAPDPCHAHELFYRHVVRLQAADAPAAAKPFEVNRLPVELAQRGYLRLPHQ